MALTFAQLRLANLDRLPQFKDAKGRLSHPRAPGRPDGHDWPLSQWSNAVLGELGEAANIIKKIERGDFTLEEARAHLADELADVQTYLDLLAYRAGVDLGAATLHKFNRVSQRVNATSRLADARMIYLASPHSHTDERVRETRYHQACRASAELFERGHYVYCPIAHTHLTAQYMLDALKWERWAAYDEMMLGLCSTLVVLTLAGWRESRGVTAEIAMATKMNMPVLYMAIDSNRAFELTKECTYDC